MRTILALLVVVSSLLWGQARAGNEADANDIPPPGPRVVYKNKALIGSTYPRADNEEFFRMAKSGIDMTEKLPSHLRNDFQLINTIIYDPPLPERKTNSPAVNTTCVYSIGSDFMQTAPVMVYRDVKFTSPLEFAVAFAGTGKLARQHHQAMSAKSRMDALAKAGRKATPEYAGLQQTFHRYVGGASKSDLALAQEQSCDSRKLQFEVYKAMEVESARRDAVAKWLSAHNCW